jgi:hypothetical protein
MCQAIEDRPTLGFCVAEVSLVSVITPLLESKEETGGEKEKVASTKRRSGRR